MVKEGFVVRLVSDFTGAFTNGRSMVNVVPVPSPAENTDNWPLCNSTIPFATKTSGMDKPI